MVFNNVDKSGLDDEDLDYSDKEYGNRKHSAFTFEVNSKRSNRALHGTPRYINCGRSVDSCIKVAEICIIKLGIFEAATSSHSNGPTTDINNHADMMLLGSKFPPVHDIDRLVNVSG